MLFLNEQLIVQKSREICLFSPPLRVGLQNNQLKITVEKIKHYA